MRVGWRRRAVRRPARMRDACGAFDAAGIGLRREIRNARRADQPMQAAVEHCKTRRIVAAILQPAHAFDENGDYVVAGYRADNAAHERLSFRRSFPILSSNL